MMHPPSQIRRRFAPARASGLLLECLEQRFLLSVSGNLIFDDEFNQAVGSLPSTSNWNYDTGTDPNNGAVNYTDTSSTMSIVSDPNATDGKALAMTIKPSGGGFVSARIDTSINPVGDNLEYGTVSARIEMPGGPNALGVWPAFWMLGNNINSVSWPECGETDIVEMKGSTPTDAQGSLHAGPSTGNPDYNPTAVDNVGSDLYSAYHVYSVSWTPTTISFAVDGNVYETQSITGENIPADDAGRFNHPFYIILNICEGGSFAGGNNGTQYTVTAPTTMYVDYVRATGYELADADIGSPGVAGSATFDGTTWTVAGSGGDIWGTSDQFNFDSQTLTGDGSITAEVTGITNSANFAKAGVMIRNTADANSAYAFTFVNPNDGVGGEGNNFEYRSAAGDASVSDNSDAYITAPEWVRLVRSGNTFTAYDSTNGVTWTPNGTPITIAMNATVDIGLAVSANSNSALNTATFQHVSILPGTVLSDNDIGSPAEPGSAIYNDSTGVYTVTGSGTDIWNDSDQFNFVSQNLSGNGSVVAEVTSIADTDTWAKAGVMLRNDDTAGSIFANVDLTPGQGVTFQYRTTANTTPASATIAGVAAPLWVEVTRSGNSFSGYYSSNGTTWTQIGPTVTLSMATNALAGLAVSSHDASAFTQGTFSNFSVTAPFASQSGGVLTVTFDANADPISLTANGSSILATENSTTLNFTSVTAVDAVYAAAGGTLGISGDLAAPITLAGASSAGALSLTSGASATLAAPASGAGITPESLAQVTIASGALLTAATPADPADRAVLLLGGLSIAGSAGSWQGLLNLTANDMILLGSNTNGATLSQTTSQLQAGYDGGTWGGGSGIVSSSAAAITMATAGASTAQPTSLGVMVNSDSSGNAYYSSASSSGAFDGQSPGATAILVKYTEVGDANLDGTVNAVDYVAIDNGFNLRLTGWANGDFNYDNTINGDDYSLIDNSFNSQQSSGAAAVSAAGAASPAESVGSVAAGNSAGRSATVNAAVAAALAPPARSVLPPSSQPPAPSAFADDQIIGGGGSPASIASAIFDSQDEGA